MPNKEQELQRQLAQISVRYLQRTLMELPQLEAAFADLRSGDTSKLEDIRQLAHKFHGSGGMFGYDAISEEAGRLEQRVDETTLCTQEFIDELALRIVRLRAEVQRACADAGQDV